MADLLRCMLAASILMLLSPIFLLIGCVILIKDGAPIFFLQERIGQGGRRFKIIKFRTMTNHDPNPMVNTMHKGRITKTGKMLRWLKLDELPQLINILRGEMAFFGPRPELDTYVRDWPTHERMRILSVRPGLIDPAVIELIDEEAILARSADPERFYREQIAPFKRQIYIKFIASPHKLIRNVKLCCGLVVFMILRISGNRND